MTQVLDAPAPVAPAAAPSPSPAPAAAPAPAVTAPYYADLFQSDGGLNHKALDRLPDHLKGIRPLLERQTKIDGIFQSWEQANTLASKKALAPLPANATPELIAERKQLMDTFNGVPKDVKDYGIGRPADLPENQWNQGLVDNFAAWAHKNSVSPSAVKELLGVQVGAVKQQLQAQSQYEQQFYAQEQQTFDAAIKRENIPAERAQALVEKGAIAFGLDLANEKTKNFLKGADARLMAMRHAIAIGEDRMVTGTEGGGNKGQDYAAMATDIQRNPANPEYAIYRNTEGKFSRSQQDAVVAKVNEWHRLAAAQKVGGKK